MAGKSLIKLDGWHGFEAHKTKKPDSQLDCYDFLEVVMLFFLVITERAHEGSFRDP